MVLTPLFLLSYEYPGHERVGRAPTEFLILKECATVRSAEDETGKVNSFRVDAKDRTFLLVATTKQEKESWIGAIAKAMVSRSNVLID